MILALTISIVIYRAIGTCKIKINFFRSKFFFTIELRITTNRKNCTKKNNPKLDEILSIYQWFPYPAPAPEISNKVEAKPHKILE
jgi:hypothetical protein